MSRVYSLLSLVCGALLVVVLCSTNLTAQKKAKPADKKAPAKAGKTSDAKRDSKSAKNQSSKQADKKKSDKNSAKTKESEKSKKREDAKSRNKKEELARKNDKKSDKKDNKRDDKREANKRDDKRGKETLAQKRERERREKAEAAEAARREAERRAAIEAERRRREQARREAIARAIAFEKGLRDETIQNILSDDTTTEDLEVRRAAIEALGNRAGTVVVMDAQNGRVVSMVNQKWAIGKGFKPCSTIKLVTGAAGLNEKVIDQTGDLTTASSAIDLQDALAYSNNPYFQKTGGAVGYSKMMNYAREFGLGAPTGINIPGESAGKLPEPKSGFPLNRMSSHGDDFEVTPIQLATMVTAIANGGTLIKPQVVRQQSKAVSFQPQYRRKVNVQPETLRGLLPGMMGAVNYGTARRAQDTSLNIGGKTGSCIGQGSWLGLFASVAPIVNPKYAVVVVTRGQNERGKWASQVAGKVYQALAPRIRANNVPQPMIAGAPVVAKPQPKIDPKAAARLSEAEGEDEEETDEAVAAGGDFVNDKASKAAPRTVNPNAVTTAPVPTPSTTNKVKTINKVYPRGQNSIPQTTKPPALLVPDVNNNAPKQAPPQQNQPAQRRPRIVQLP